MIRAKTGGLFATSCEVGAMLASSDDSVLLAAWEFGLNMGLAFQIHDDYLGVWGNEALVGKTANDIEEKKRSLPVVLSLEYLPDSFITPYRTLRNWLNADFISKEDAADIRDWMARQGIPEKVKSYEMRFIKHARQYLKNLSLKQEWHGQFEEVLNFLSEREI